MQPFCFFVATKEVGVWGLVPTNNKELINVIVLFPAARPEGLLSVAVWTSSKEPKSASVLVLYIWNYKANIYICM